MPLYSSGQFSGHTHWVIWKAEEDDDFFASALDPSLIHSQSLLKRYHPRRKSEWLCSRFVIQHCLNKGIAPILNNDGFGRTLLGANPNAQFVSISHSYPWIAVVRSPHSCGIDIQQWRPGIEKLASRFMHSDEWQLIEGLDIHYCVHWIWSAKEAMFKAFPGKKLPFKTSLRVYRLNNSGSESGAGEVVKNPESIKYQLYTLPFSEGTAIVCQPKEYEVFAV